MPRDYTEKPTRSLTMNSPCVDRYPMYRQVNSNGVGNQIPPNSSRASNKSARKQTATPTVQGRSSAEKKKRSGRTDQLSRKQASAAAAYATGQSSGAPIIRASRDRSRIVHRELVQSISGTSAFAVASSLALNPGIASTFPWLSTQAQAWEQYRFNRLAFKYYTRTGSSTTGSMMLVPDYDPADAAPSSEAIASSYEDVQEDAPWKDISCELRPRAMHSIGPLKYIRSGPLASNLDIKTYDVGTMFPCTVDGDAVGWGKLWVEYDVELVTPQLPSSGLAAANVQHFPLATNAPTSAAALGAVPASIGSTLATMTGNVLTFSKAGRFLCMYSSAATSTVINTNLAVGGGGALVATYGNIGGLILQSPASAALSVQGAVLDAIVGSTVTFANTVVGGTGADLIIAQLPSALA